MNTIYTEWELILKKDKVSCDYSVPATCTSNATCKWCGAEDPNGSHAPNNHANGCTLSDWIITAGEHYKEYSLCGAKESAHAPCEVGVAAVSATCLTAGTTAGTKCSTCGTILSGVQEDPQKAHSYTGAYVDKGDEGHAQKCVNGCDGLGGTVAHSGNWVVTKDATCTAEGEETQTCVCGHVTTRETNMLDHKDEDPADNICDDCGATICDHDLQVVRTTPATCTTGTITVEKCTKCEFTKTTEADDAGHTYGELIAEKAATCTVDGMKAHYVCSVCNKLFDENKEETTEEALVIKAPGTHTWTEGAVNTETYERVDTCQKGDATRTVSLVARIGDVYFETLQAAVNAAANGDTVEVLRDCTGATVTKKITLNVPAGVTVSNKPGTDSKGNPYTYAIVVSGANADLTITGAGTIQGSTYGVVAQSSGKLTVNMNGGTIKGATAGMAGIYATSKADVSVTNGTISGKYGIYAYNSTAKISGTAKVTGDPAVITTGTAVVDIFGSAVVEGTNYGVQAQLGGHVNIYDDAEVSGSQVALYVRGAKTDAPALTGDARTMATVSGKCNITSSGFAISGNGSSDGTVIEISGGTITSTASTAIYHPQVGDLTISGGTITGMNGVQHSGVGAWSITGGTITAKLPYTEAPQKPVTQTDGTIADGAALSIVSRGGGWQSEGDTMNVTIAGGTFISENNSAIAVYRIKQDKDTGAWQVGEATNLPSYLGTLTIKEGENGSIPVFSGNPEKGVLDIEALAMGAKHITGGTFNQDIDAGAINYVDETYESHEIQSGYDYAGWYNVHKPVADRADCVTCTPPTPPTTPTTTYYTLTIRYVDAQGNQVAPTATRRLAEGSRYTVDSPAVEGMTPDQETVTGILNSRTEITVTYAADENVDDNQTPTTEAPETSEPTETQEPDETQPPEETEDLGENDTPLTETPDEAEDLGDNDTPLADVPQTGDMLWLWILLAVVSASGLIWISLEEKKGRRVA